jgi:hypothetical protein
MEIDGVKRVLKLNNVTGTQQQSVMFSKRYQVTDGIVEASMKYNQNSNSNLLGRVTFREPDAPIRLAYGIGGAGLSSSLYLFKYDPSFVSLGSTSFTHGTGYNIYQLSLSGSTIKGSVPSATTPPSITATDTLLKEGPVGFYLNTSEAFVDWIRVRKNLPSGLAISTTDGYGSEVTR